MKVFLKKREFKLLVNDLELIPKPFICLLFGSHVKGSASKTSDIDLLFIVPDNEEKFESRIINISRTIPLKLHINIFKESEFIAMKNSML